MTASAISGNHAVRTLTQIMMNGARFSLRTFPLHDGLLIKLRNAFDLAREDEKQAEAEFLRVLRTYLTQAQGHVPHVPKEESDITRLLGELILVIHEFGLTQVAPHILAHASAPVDRF